MTHSLRKISFLIFPLIMTSVIGIHLQTALAALEFSEPVLTDFTNFDNPFSDTDLSSDEGRAAAELSRRGVVQGFSDGEFKGRNPVTRAEALKILLQTRYITIPSHANDGWFHDVEAGSWYEPYVMRALELGIVSGYGNGNFGPGDVVTTAQFLKIMTGTFDLEMNSTYSYEDVSPGRWVHPYAGIAQTYDLFPERTTALLPDRILTRREVTVAVYHYLKKRDEIQEMPETEEENKPEETTGEEPGTDEETAGTEGEGEESDEGQGEEVEIDRALQGVTYVAGAKDVPIWTGTFTANSVRDLVIRNMVFQQIGTATDSDTHDFSLAVEEVGSKTLLLEASGEMENGVLNFFQGSTGIFLQKSTQITVTLRTNIAPTLSANGATVQIQLDEAHLEIEDSKGKVVDTSAIEESSGPIFTLVEAGDLALAISGSSDTPDSRILLGGSEDVPVSIFEFQAGFEGVHLEDITLIVDDIDTTAILGMDVPEDSNAIREITLYDAVTGTPVLTMSGALARTTVLSDGTAFFQDLNIMIDRKQEYLLLAAVSLNGIDADVPLSTARSGMAFAVNVSLAGENTVRGLSSGEKLSLNAIGGGANTDIGETMYVLDNRLTVTKAQASQFLGTGNQQELLRFQVYKETPSKDAFLRTVEARISAAGGATVDNVGLYNDDNELIAFVKIPSSGNTYSLLVGIEDSNGDGINDPGSAAANGLNFSDTHLLELPQGSGDLSEEIGGAEETYTIRADLTTDGSGDQVATTLFINAPLPGQDGITWRDSGGDHGESGMTLQWIDLGSEDTETNRIDHVLVN